MHGFYFEDLHEGQEASFSKTITEADVVLFAGVTGDLNPVHINEEFAKTTMFEGRIVHGILSAGLISAVLGMHLPGPGCIYVSQNVRFKRPVRIGDTVTARARVTGLSAEKRLVTLETVCLVGGKEVLTGEAVLKVDARPA